MAYSASTIFWMVMVLVGCIANHTLLEALVTHDPGIGPLVTLTYFITPTIEGLRHFVTLRPPFFVRPKVPMVFHLSMVALYFSLSLLNNMAFNYRIPMAFHTVFRSSSLISNVLVGYLVLRKSYPARKLASVGLVTAGIVAATLGSAKTQTEATEEEFSTWVFGVGVLVATAFLSTFLGVLQEYISRRFGKSPEENLFFSHALSLPFFALVSRDVGEHLTSALRSRPIELFGGALSLPVTVVTLVATNITQLLCIKSVFKTIADTDSLTVTLLVTLRKFISVVLSVIYFGAPFTPILWAGSIAAFLGAYLFTTATDEPPKQQKDDKGKKD